MTTIAALHVPGWGTVVSSDSQVTCGNTMLTGGSKWIITDDWGVGVAGDYRMIVLLQQHFKELVEDNIAAFTLCERIIAMMTEYKYEPDRDESCSGTYDNCLLLASNKGVWNVDASMTPVPIPANRLMADGSGYAFAMGAGHALRNQQPLDRMKHSMEAALLWDIGSSGKVWTHVLPHPSQISNVVPFRASKR